MFRINKREKQYLIDNGCRYPKDLHTTLHGKTYATEFLKVMRLLNKYYKEHTVFAKQ